LGIIPPGTKNVLLSLKLMTPAPFCALLGLLATDSIAATQHNTQINRRFTCAFLAGLFDCRLTLVGRPVN